MIANIVIKIDASDLKLNDEVVKRFTKSGLWQDL
jgi:oligoribonuclease (3'-5' exoribonuclease)